MLSLSVIADSAPFDAEQRVWLDGYPAGLFSLAALGSSSAILTDVTKEVPLTILYGTQTGSAAWLSKKIAATAKKRDFVEFSG